MNLVRTAVAASLVFAVGQAVAQPASTSAGTSVVTIVKDNAVLISGVAFRQASYRLSVRSERALYDFRERLIGHIHRLSLADRGEERRGGLVARVTSDIETLAQFFQWGGMSWMRNSALMLIVSVVMLVYDPLLACVAFAVALPLALVLRAVQRRLVVAHGEARERNGEMLGAIAEVGRAVEGVSRRWCDPRHGCCGTSR